MKNLLSDRYLDDGAPTISLNGIQKEGLKLFSDKCKHGAYEWENFSCECGNASEFEILSEKDRYGLPVRTVICPCCGLVMTNPRMTQESYDRFYETEYPVIYRGTEKPADKFYEERVEYGRKLVDFIESKCTTGKSILEIGCSSGGIVKAFEERGYQGLGIDLSPSYIEYGKRKGINLRCCHSSQLAEEGKTYDIIILNHVLEHFTDLGKELKIVRKLLSSEGILFIAVPGIKNIWFSYDNDFLLFLQNAHIYHFTKDTLVQVLRWHGFEAIYANEKVEGLFRIGEKRKEVENFYNDIVNFLQDTEKDRKNREMYFPLRCKNILDTISAYKNGEVAIYGTGSWAERLLHQIGRPEQIKGFVTNAAMETEYMGWPILRMDGLNNIRCIIIASEVYKEVIYERIKFLEKEGIKIIQLFPDS